QKALDTRTPAQSQPERKIQSTIASIRVVQSAVDRGTVLTSDLLLRIHDPLPEEATRQVGGEPVHDATAKESERATARITAFSQWTAADSFMELNALEQVAIIVLRLLEIRPFQEGNVAAAVGAGSLFTMRVGWPPVIIPGHLRPKFNPAIGEGLKMNTRPLVDLLAESLYEALDSSIKFIKDLRTSTTISTPSNAGDPKTLQRANVLTCQRPSPPRPFMINLWHEPADPKMIGVDSIQLVFNRHYLAVVVEFMDGKALVTRCGIQSNRKHPS